MKLLRTFALGAAAGLAGTAAITACQAAAARLQGENAGTDVPERWEEAPAPAQVAKKATAMLGADILEREHVPLVTNGVHWLYGITWGVAYTLAARRLRPAPLTGSLVLGTGLWGLSYAELVPLGIAKPPWKEPAKELALDGSFHLVYGAAVAGTVAALAR